MKYASICSGIEAASVAWHPLGWQPVFFAETDPFCRAVLKARWPGVPNWGDVTRYEEWPDAAFDVLVGGTPCQSFSVAGLRAGLADPRGNLALVYGAIARRYRPRWLVWENVPGVLSSNGGRDFGAFLGMLAELGYGFAYRVLDAQYVRVDGHARAVPQRRRRVFVVGHLGSWQRACAVLFEQSCMSGHPPPKREARKIVAGPIAGCSNGGGANGPGRTADDADSLVAIAPTIPSRSTAGGGLGTDFDCDGGLIVPDVSVMLCGRDYKGPLPEADLSTVVAHALRDDGFDASEDGTGRGTPLVAFNWQAGLRDDPAPQNDVSVPLRRKQTPAVAFNAYQRAVSDENSPLTTNPGYIYGSGVLHHMAVRRLTPRECERLQGLPDDYTLITHSNGKSAADGPRYRALGNSFAVNVVRWIGQRVQLVEELSPVPSPPED